MLSLSVAQNEKEITTMLSPLSLSVAQHENEDDDAFPKCGAK